MRAWSQPEDPESVLSRSLSVWLLGSVLLPIFFPGRQVPDIAWALIPLWTLAAIELAHQVPSEFNIDLRWVAAGQAVALAFILMLIGYFVRYLIGLRLDSKHNINMDFGFKF